jgi:L-threonylcarbamoyladenylate synthase
VTVRVLPDDEAGRIEAAELLRAGGLVALPTDTVYGIAVDLGTSGGVDRLFAAKNRPPDKGVVLLLAEAAQATEVGLWDDVADALADAFWPGGLTLILRQRPGLTLPPSLTGGTLTIGVRLPDHPAPRSIAATLGPLPTTSANLSGGPEARDAREIVDQLGSAVDLVLDGGPAPGGPASTVVDLTGAVPRILRAGAVPIDRVEAILATAGVSLPAADVGR